MHWKILSLTLLIIACEHTPKGKYYVDLNRETFGNISIDLLNQPDTILLLQETNFNYNIKLKEDQVIRNMEITVDGEVISSTGLAYNTFRLIPGDYESGLHVLKAEVITSSGTGSISDLAGAESLLYTREWIIVIDHTLPEGLIIISIAEFNGKLKIEWTKNNSLNFKHYLVYRILNNPFTHSSNETGLAMISDPDSNWYVDDSYVGGQVTYYIENAVVNNTVHGVPRSYEGLYPTFISAQKTDMDKVKLTWHKTRFPGNLGKYEITVRDRINETFTPLFSSDNPNDTSYTVSLTFGDSTDIWLKTIPGKLNYWYPETMSDRIAVYAGEKVPKHMSCLLHSNNPDIVYLVDHNSISRYNLNTGETEQTIETGYNDWERRNTFISPDGNYLVRFADGVAYLLDPVNLSTTASISLSQFFWSSNPLRINYVTDNGWLSVSKDEWPCAGGIIDLVKGDTLFTVKGINPLTIIPSPAGKYMIINDSWTSTLYTYDGGLTKLHELGSDMFEFNPLNDEEVYRFSTTHDNSISLLKCSDLQVVKSFTPSAGLGLQDIDPVSGLIMIYRYSDIYIVDLDQKSVVTTEKISELVYWQECAYFNNTLFSGFGYKLSLKP